MKFETREEEWTRTQPPVGLDDAAEGNNHSSRIDIVVDGNTYYCAFEWRIAPGCATELVEDSDSVEHDVRDQCIATFNSEFGTSDWILPERGQGVYRLFEI